MKTTEQISSGPENLWNSILRFINVRSQPGSILRNQTNLPMFLVMALGLSVLCNFTLRENTAEASRPIGTSASIERVRAAIRQTPEDYELHTRIAELYIQEKNYRRAMFHFAESTRLIDLFGE